MNKTGLVEMMQKRTTKLVVYSDVFEGKLVFLVPMLIDEADARTKVTITSTAGPFYNSDIHLTRCKFWTNPSYLPRDASIVVKWTSWGRPPVGDGTKSTRFIADVYSGGVGMGM